MERGSLKRILFRTTFPVVVYSFLVYLCYTSSNWKGLFCLFALAVTIIVSAWIVINVMKMCKLPENCDEDLRKKVFAGELLLTKRLGGIFCTMTVGVGVCALFGKNSQFFTFAICILLVGLGVMLLLANRTRYAVGNLLRADKKTGQ